MIKLTDLLTEIGDSTPFKFTFKDVDPEGVSMFYFTTKSGLKYELSVSVEDIEGQGPTAIANFDVLPDPDQTDREEFAMTNKFEMLPIMSTVIIAMNLILKKRPDIKVLQFSAKQEKSEKEDDANRRRNIYLAYIRKMFPQSEVTQSGENTIVKIK